MYTRHCVKCPEAPAWSLCRSTKAAVTRVTAITGRQVVNGYALATSFCHGKKKKMQRKHASTCSRLTSFFFFFLLIRHCAADSKLSPVGNKVHSLDPQPLTSARLRCVCVILPVTELSKPENGNRRLKIQTVCSICAR